MAMTRIELHQAIEKLLAAKVRQAEADRLYNEAYWGVWDEIEKHYPIQPREGNQL